MHKMFSSNIKTVSRLIYNSSKYLRLFSQQAQQDIVFQKFSNEDSGIAVLGLNRPKQRNAFGSNLVREMEEILDQVYDDKKIRVLLLRSMVPGIFCAGADLKERAKLTPEEVAEFVKRLRALMSLVNSMPMPVLACLDGTALGGGLEIALACDIRIASTTAKMGLVETKLAIIPGAGGTQRLPRLINPSIAKELIYTAKILDGSQAEKIGLVNYAVKQNEEGNAAYLKALEVAREIVPNGPVAVRMAKQSIDRGIDSDIQSALKFEELCYSRVIPTEDRIEGLKAFSEKRAPKYTGQ